MKQTLFVTVTVVSSDDGGKCWRLEWDDSGVNHLREIAFGVGMETWNRAASTACRVAIAAPDREVRFKLGRIRRYNPRAWRRNPTPECL